MIMIPKHLVTEKEQLTEQLRMKSSASFIWIFISTLNITVGFFSEWYWNKTSQWPYVNMWLSPEEVKAKSSSLQKGDELKMICDSLSLLIPKDSIQALLTKRTKMSLSYQEILSTGLCPVQGNFLLDSTIGFM